MQTTCKILVVSLLVLVGITAGCSKQVTFTIYNHSDAPCDIKITVPDQSTHNCGSVASDGGSLVYTLKIDNKQLPARCNLSDGHGQNQPFTVTEFTKPNQWFHIKKDGTIAGPLDKDSGITHTSDPDVIRTNSGSRMIVD